MLKCEVLELPLELPDTQSIRQGRINLHRLLGNAAALSFRQGVQRSHVVQAVSELDEDHPDVIGHGQEHLAHVLGPDRLLPHRVGAGSPAVATVFGGVPPAHL